MLNELQQAERSRAGVRRWYGENREEYNALRRKRYAESQEAQNKARDRATNYRGRQRAGKVEIDRKLTRELDGKTIVVLSTGQAAELMDRTPQMLRNWEREGIIPESVFPDTHRLYTKKQARMIITLGRVIKRNGGAWDSTQALKYRASMVERW